MYIAYYGVCTNIWGNAGGDISSPRMQQIFNVNISQELSSEFSSACEAWMRMQTQRDISAGIRTLLTSRMVMGMQQFVQLFGHISLSHICTSISNPVTTPACATSSMLSSSSMGSTGTNAEYMMCNVLYNIK